MRKKLEIRPTREPDVVKKRVETDDFSVPRKFRVEFMDILKGTW